MCLFTGVRIFFVFILHLVYKYNKEENRRKSSVLCEPTTIKYDQFRNEPIHLDIVKLEDGIDINYDKINRKNLANIVTLITVALDRLWSFVVLFMIALMGNFFGSFIINWIQSIIQQNS